MTAAINLENGIIMEIGDGVNVEYQRIPAIAAAALAGIGERHYFLAAVNQEPKPDNMMSPADRALGLYGVVIEAVRGDGNPRLHLSAQFPTATLRRLKDEGKIV